MGSELQSVAEPLDGYGLHDPALELALARYKSESGDVRLKDVQGALELNLEEHREILGELYKEWLLDDVGIVVEETKKTWRIGTDWTTVKVLKYSKARKRGNDMDAFRISRKTRALKDAIIPYCESENHLKETRALYVTLTVDPRMTDGDLESAWRHVGRWFNDFKSRLAKTFGSIYAYVDKKGEYACRAIPCKIHVLRSWEAHESGWPHVHAVLCFEDFNFAMFQDAKFRWRAKQKDKIAEAWPYGFVDVVALTPGTAERELENVLWYVSKNLSSMDYRLVHSWPKKRILTQSILWYLRARAFSISKHLASRDLTKRVSITQNDLEGGGFEIEVLSYKFLGLVRRSRTELHRDDWAKTYAEPPDWLDDVWKPHSFQHGLDYSWLSRGS
jgi:hypothetical protein